MNGCARPHRLLTPSPPKKNNDSMNLTDMVHLTTGNKCLASSNKCLTSSNKKLLT